MRSESTTRRAGASAAAICVAADSTLYRFTEVESATTSSPAPAPTSRAILSAIRCDSVIQPASFQLRIRPSPHSVVDDLPHARGRRPRQRAERVAIEVDETAGIRRVERELRAQRRQHVVPVQRQARVSRRRRTSPSTLASRLLSWRRMSRVPAARTPESSRPSSEPLLRAIGTFGLAAAIVNITVGGGIFRLPSSVAGSLGAAAPIAYLVCAVAMGLIVLCIADAGSRVSLTGGPYAYVGAALGPYAAFLSGVLLWMLGPVRDGRGGDGVRRQRRTARAGARAVAAARARW